MEFDYPIYKKSKNLSQIIKFTGLEKGIVIAQGDSTNKVGYTSNNFISHTNTNIWEDTDFREKPKFNYCLKK